MTYPVLLPFSTNLLAVARGKSSSQLVAIKTKFKLFIVILYVDLKYILQN